MDTVALADLVTIDLALVNEEGEMKLAAQLENALRKYGNAPSSLISKHMP